ncbi:MAG: hypothetical protein LBP30_03180, partial [Clostridiales Family XIII bacterium]|nr:hypothetical protein [Clostridiales Family XIII bacterium]
MYGLESKGVSEGCESGMRTAAHEAAAACGHAHDVERAAASGCAHCPAHGGESEEPAGGNLKSPLFVAGVLLFAAGLVLTYGGFATNIYIAFAVFAAAYLAVAKDVLLYAAKNIARGKIFDENFLMTIASLGAFAIGEYPEAVAVILFYNVGEYMQERVVRRSRKSIESLMDIRPDVA